MNEKRSAKLLLQFCGFFLAILQDFRYNKFNFSCALADKREGALHGTLPDFESSVERGDGL